MKSIHSVAIKLVVGIFLLNISLLSLAQTSKPNIVLIMTDDQGYGDLGFTGNPHLKTPNIDQLASKSTRLTNYHHSPVCAPTRSSLLTGRYHQRTGVHDTYNGGAIMATEEVTLAEILSQNGYKTGIVGKWHLGDDYPFRPSEQGFQYSLVHRGGGIGQPGDPLENFLRTDSSYFNTILSENNNEIKANGYCTDYFTDGALKFIQANKKAPFFLYVAYNAPHDPLQVPQKYLDLYKDLKFDSPLDTQTDKAWAKMTPKDKDDAIRVYAMISNIDDNVGRILEELKAQQLDKNTIVIFTSDNGNQQLRFNTGFRGLKGGIYEGGVRVPFFISGKNIPANKEVPQLLAHVDVLPTLLEAINIQVPKDLHIDGQSAWPLIQGKKDLNTTGRIFYNSWNRGWPEPYRNAAIYSGEFKLVAFNAEGNDINTFRLFNLQKDPYEQNNLVGTEKVLANRLKRSLDSIFADISSSPNLVPRRVILGSSSPNPVTLTRQDLAGSGVRNWTGDNAFGVWPVHVAEEGNYSFEFINTKPNSKGVRAVLRLGQIQRSKVSTEELSSVTIENVFLKKGDYDIESWFENIIPIGAPYYLKVTKISH